MGWDWINGEATLLSLLLISCRLFLWWLVLTFEWGSLYLGYGRQHSWSDQLLEGFLVFRHAQDGLLFGGWAWYATLTHAFCPHCTRALLVLQEWNLDLTATVIDCANDLVLTTPRLWWVRAIFNLALKVELTRVNLASFHLGLLLTILMMVYGLVFIPAVLRG